ncbi:MAG: hypothetical protein Pg6A_02460 [Termitinemataceae bacterium]|nr:MAG: hypothetical protein Pg6A_02460 [Termitinemataceae bacterium]
MDLMYKNENNKELHELLDFIKNYISENGIESMNTEYYDNLTIFIIIASLTSDGKKRSKYANGKLLDGKIIQNFPPVLP